jgi:hypothetical protein
MAKSMASGTFRLKGSALQKMAQGRGVPNRHQVSLEAGVSYPTVDKYLRQPETVGSIHLRSLAGILVDAMKMSPEEALELRLGDIFEFIPRTNGAE